MITQTIEKIDNQKINKDNKLPYNDKKTKIKDIQMIML